MKILMICDFFHENCQYQENFLAKYYLKLNHEVVIIASTFSSVFDYYSQKYNKSSKECIYFIKGYKVYKEPYKINYLNKVRRLANVYNILCNENPDVVYVHGPTLNIIDAVKFKKQYGTVRLIYDFHGDFSNSASNWASYHILHKLFFRKVIQKHINYLDKIFYITPESGEFLNKLYKIPYNKMELLPLGADLDLIKEVKQNNFRNQIREKFGINPDDVVVFTGGKIDSQKRTHLVIESFLELSSKISHLIIVGDTKEDIYKTKILDLIANHSHIHYLGWIDANEIYYYLVASDIAIYPSSQSILWQQSIGMGLPIIVGQVKNQDASYLNQNGNVILLEENNITKEEILKHTELLINDRSKLNYLKSMAEKTAEEYLSFEKITLSTLSD
jgi:glycosyltransferase involved in cell wall biosynthesis